MANKKPARKLKRVAPKKKRSSTIERHLAIRLDQKDRELVITLNDEAIQFARSFMNVVNWPMVLAAYHFNVRVIDANGKEVQLDGNQNQ